MWFPEILNAAAVVLLLDSWPPCVKRSDNNGTFWAEVAADTLWHDGRALRSCSIYNEEQSKEATVKRCLQFLLFILTQHYIALWCTDAFVLTAKVDDKAFLMVCIPLKDIHQHALSL